MPTMTRSSVEKQVLGEAIARRIWPTIGLNWSDDEQEKYNPLHHTVLMVTVDMKPGCEDLPFPNYKELLLFEQAIIEEYVLNKTYSTKEEQFWYLNAKNWIMAGPWPQAAGRHWDNILHPNKTEIYAIGDPQLDVKQFYLDFKAWTIKQEDCEEDGITRIKSPADERNFRISCTLG